MRVDISLRRPCRHLHAVFARVGAMVMLLPGFGESNIPVRVKLGLRCC
jgi:flagellar biosynthetic protein FliR